MWRPLILATHGCTHTLHLIAFALLGNPGSHQFLIVGMHTGWPLKRTLIKWNMPNLAPDEVVVSATMRLYFLYAHRASNQPNEPWIPRWIFASPLLVSCCRLL